MARTREFDQNQALDCALEVFWRKGYAAASMADLVEETGVARYGLYQAFGDKDELYRQALRRYRRMMEEDLLAPLMTPGAGLGALEQHFNRLLGMLDDGERRGCLACQAAVERSVADDEVARLVADTLAVMRVAFAHALGNALSKGQVRALPITDLTEFLVGLMRTMSTLARAGTPADEIQTQVRCALALLRS
jgi:TetR/AcrR family transcriptional repressor of nem operon